MNRSDFTKTQPIHSCKGILKADLENNKSFKENNAYVQEAMKGLAEKVRINIEYKIMNANIKDGFKVIPLLCNNKRCDCAYAQYKELLYPKDDNQITKFILNKVNL